jgi:hypothetical protein
MTPQGVGIKNRRSARERERCTGLTSIKKSGGGLAERSKRELQQGATQSCNSGFAQSCNSSLAQSCTRGLAERSKRELMAKDLTHH